MKIGELALAAQTQVETIRYYEREGLLPQESLMRCFRVSMPAFETL